MATEPTHSGPCIAHAEARLRKYMHDHDLDPRQFAELVTEWTDLVADITLATAARQGWTYVTIGMLPSAEPEVPFVVQLGIEPNISAPVYGVSLAVALNGAAVAFTAAQQ